MAKKAKTLPVQVKELAERIEKLETDLIKKPIVKPRQSDKNGKSHFCSMPKVLERQFASDVSPFREMLIRYIDRKWVNGTKLRYYIFNEGSFAGTPSNINLVKDGFKVWENIGIGIDFEQVNEIAEAEIRIGFLRDGRSWSYVGRDNLDIPGQFERTMNFGWDLTQDSRPC